MEVKLDQLVEDLSSSGLMSADEASALCKGLSATGGAAESEAVVQELSATGKLTSFQAERICQGQTSGLVFGEYVVFDKIGAGGMGEVYKAQHRRMKRDVAIKMLPKAALDSEDAVKRFYREVEAAAKLNHPNIVTAHDAGNKGDLHFLVMEYVEGRDLSDVVDDGGPLPVDQAMDAILQAARGLEYAHKKGVTHRDIKPANLLLDNEGTVKILDMGLARVESGTGAPDAGAGLTSTGQIMGTSDYIPPEQAMDTRKADARSDIYSLGCTLYRLLTGNTPYSGDTVMKKIMAHMSDPIPSLREARPDVPEALEELYRCMLAKEPNDRPQTMTEVIATLEDIIRGPSTRSSENTGAGGAASDAELASFFDQMSHAPAAPSISSRPGPKAGAAKTTTPVKDKTEPVAEETIDLPSQDDTSRSVTAAEAAVTKVPAPQPEAAKKPAPKPRKRVSAQRKKQSRQLLLIGIGVGLSLIGAAIVAAVIYVQTSRGTIIVDTRDENVEVAVTKGGEVVSIINAKDRWRVEVKSGDYHVELKGSDDQFVLDKDAITVTRGGEVRVRVELKPRPKPPDPAIAPFDTAQAKKHQKEWADYLGMPAERDFDLPGGVKLTMMLIPPGEFLMGSTAEEQARFLEEAKGANDTYAIGRIPTEGPQHRVRITRPFYLGKHEVTQAQWEAVMGDNPSKFKDAPLHPVGQVSWEDIQPFLGKLNAAGTLRLPSGRSTLKGDRLEFALPTEAQWEYACRAGTTTFWHNGDTEESLRESGWFNVNMTHSVGQLKANAWGLYDMHGNVWEWCADWHGRDYYGQSPTSDPSGPPTGSRRVHRGGSWSHHASYCRSACRDDSSLGFRNGSLGLRLACEIPYSPVSKPAVPVVSSSKPLPDWQLPPDAPDPAIAPFDADKAKEHQQKWAKYLGLPVEKDFDLPGGEKLTMVLIPPGEFMMGSTEEEQARFMEEARAADAQGAIDRIPSEGPQHRVRITRPFYLGKNEVTQAQWEAVMGDTPSDFKGNPSHPVEQVSWDDMRPFLEKLNAAGTLRLFSGKSTLAGECLEFSLPTEAHWEYACRAGTATSRHNGDTEEGLRESSWFNGNSGGKTHPVGQLKANAWGLYDMYGNVSEWCADWYGADYYRQSPTNDPEGPATGSERVRRGVGWQDHAMRCRSADRHKCSPDYRYNGLGLRLACTIPYVPATKPAVPAASPSQPPMKGPDATAPSTASLDDLPPWQLPPNAPKPAIAPFDADKAKEHQKAWANYLGLPVEKEFDLPGGEKLTMVLIPPGEFMMGSTEEDQVQVHLTKPFYLGKYEVTQSEWKAVMSNNLSRFQDDRNPVEMVNWNDCTAFIAKLQVQLADPESGIEFALPTAAQWEYACRAGTQTRFYFGDDPRGTELVDYAWYEANSDHKAHAVGEKVPNAWGLYDMHGNVSEWCQDWSGVYQDGDPKDPSGPTSGRYRVRRGGGWSYSSKYCRSSHRYRKDPGQRTGDIGLRVALNLSKEGAYRLPYGKISR